jgi:hypothetical protein
MDLQAETVPDLAPDLLSPILAYVPLRKLAKLAPLNKEICAAYVARVGERDRVITELLESSQFTDKLREGLPGAQTALPLDLVADPPVRTYGLESPCLCYNININ